MSYLKQLLNILEKQTLINENKTIFFIPTVWDVLAYGEKNLCEKKPGEIGVCAYDFYKYYIEYVLSQRKENLMLQKSRPITGENMYCAQLRMLTSWRHLSNKEIRCGTFLKSILMLPYLKSMGISMIYLLPVFKTGTAYKKGDMGSVYAIQNIYKLDPNLHDPILGLCTDELLELEFQAFVESCHILEIKVIQDFVFRTVSRDCDLLVEHPNWFYWIKADGSFQAPDFEGIPELTTVNIEWISKMYENPNLREYLSKFTFSPDVLDGEKWNGIKQKYESSGTSAVLKAVEEEYHITTAPAFSDVLNDFQAPWQDVTYIKMSFDTHDQAKKYVRAENPPYIMQDIAKASVCCGREKNKELWNYIVEIIPYYQKKYGIDGARIDMAHALPDLLNERIIETCKKYNKNFILWSEEMQLEKAGTARKKGFHFISGKIWGRFREYQRKSNLSDLQKEIIHSELPVVSCLESPDTLRIPYFIKEQKILWFMMGVSCFIPNTVTMINNGMEIGEKEPMNYGFDNIDDINSILSPEDEMNGKLSMFDNYMMHWSESNVNNTKDILTAYLRIKNNYVDLLWNKEEFMECSKCFNNREMLLWRYGSVENFFYLIGYIGREDIGLGQLLQMALPLDKCTIHGNPEYVFYVNEKGIISVIEDIQSFKVESYEIIFVSNRSINGL